MLRVRFQSQMHVVASKNIDYLQQLKASIKTIFSKTPKQFDLYYEVDKHLLKLQNQKTDKLNAQQIKDIIQNKTRLEIVQTHSQNNLVREAIEFDQQLIKSLQSSLVQSLHINQNILKQQPFEKNQNKKSSILSAEDLQIQQEKEEWVNLQIQEKQDKKNINQQNLCFKNQLSEQSLMFANKDKDLKKSNIQISLSKRQAEHQVQCDNCFCFPIKNIRYKCSICEDFDLCSQCQNKIFHSHPFLKIKDIKQSISSIQVIFDENMIQIMKQKQQLYELVVKNQKEKEKQRIKKQHQVNYEVPDSQRRQVNIEGNNFLGCALGMKTQQQRKKQIRLIQNIDYYQDQQYNNKFFNCDFD